MLLKLNVLTLLGFTLFSVQAGLLGEALPDLPIVDAVDTNEVESKNSENTDYNLYDEGCNITGMEFSFCVKTFKIFF